jgi:hypothetical protein
LISEDFEFGPRPIERPIYRPIERPIEHEYEPVNREPVDREPVDPTDPVLTVPDSNDGYIYTCDDDVTQCNPNEVLPSGCGSCTI